MASFPLTNCGQAKNQSAQPSYSPSQNFTTIVKAPIISLFVWYNNKLREFLPFLGKNWSIISFVFTKAEPLSMILFMFAALATERSLPTQQP